MEKRDSDTLGSTTIKKKPVVSEEKPAIVPEKATGYNKVVKLRSTYSADMTLTGESGKSYRWPAAGAVQAVLATDAPALLAKIKNKNACCGGRKPIPLFEVVEE